MRQMGCRHRGDDDPALGTLVAETEAAGDAPAAAEPSTYYADAGRAPEMVPSAMQRRHRDRQLGFRASFVSRLVAATSTRP